MWLKREGCRKCRSRSPREGLCEQNPQATVISIDGLSAFDQISRAAVLDGLLNVANCGAVLPFVRMFHGGPSSYLWEDSAGTVHTIRQGEGGEQGHALMPLLLALGQHSALDAVQDEFPEGDMLLAFTTDRVPCGSHLCRVARASLCQCKDQDQWWQDAGVEPREGRDEQCVLFLSR